MVCSSGIGFDPVVGGRRLTFGFEGIWQGTAVLYDHQTDSLWMHLSGECFSGEHEGTVLKRLPTGRHTTWEDWENAHPRTEVLRPDPALKNRGGDRGYFTRDGARAGSKHVPRGFARTIQTRDDRLGPHVLVYGVVVDGIARAYRLDAMPGSVHEEIGSVQATIWYDKSSWSAAAFDRRVGDRLLTFDVEPGPGLREDRETKSRWNMEGECIAGPLKGSRLRPLHGLMAEWYGWYAHYPGTSLR